MTDARTSSGSPAAENDNGAMPLRTLALLAVPAVIIGVVSALILWGLEWVADQFEDYLWHWLPHATGLDPNNGWYIFTLLSLSGVAIGLVVWLVPGHGARDSATTELIAPPLKLAVIPSLVLVTILALAGGVSLGPENPIIAINTAVLVALIARLMPKVPTQLILLLAAAGTIGALFGTPVAAALVFTGVVAALKTGGSLWDRMFLPVAAAGAGSVTMGLLGGSTLTVNVPQMGPMQPIYFVYGLGVAIAATLLGLVMVFVFPHVHRFFHGLKYPIIYITLGGVVLGLLGALGGQITLFKGLSEMATLVNNRGDYDLGQLTLITLVKVAALVVAASAGFRGGRIFPAVFIGVALGLVAETLFPQIPISLALACGVLGLVLVVARDGWLALFIAAAVVGDVALLSVLCVIILPIWLMVSRAPEMIIHPAPQPRDPAPEPVAAAPA
ncbi:ion channel protein [Subtercola lobariae]|uniref:Ion-transport protein n=1 Tax=Subtercola lobariae TaxID=1588641 RepID=A0A917BAA9_9MICO|nr:ion channel protein [Subtercola lobariae]GGF30898.1 putative ion-transport protein [Subtercola lobariae]